MERTYARNKWDFSLVIVTSDASSQVTSDLAVDSGIISSTVAATKARVGPSYPRAGCIDKNTAAELLYVNLPKQRRPNDLPPRPPLPQTNASLGNVTSSVTWPFDSHHVISCRCSTDTSPLSWAVFEIFSLKHIWVATLIFRVTWRHRSCYRSICHRRFPI